MYTEYCLENVNGKRLLGRLRSRWEDNIKRDSGKHVMKMINGFSWFMIWSNGRLLT
jgi:hypothetical protein